MKIIICMLLFSSILIAQRGVYESEKITTSSRPYYYMSSLKSNGGVSDIAYAQNYPSGSSVDLYQHYTKETLKVSKKQGSFSIYVMHAYPDSVTGLWIDWNGDGYFYNNYHNNKTDPEDELIEPTFGELKRNNLGVLKVSVKIPSNALVCLSRMRFQTVWRGDVKYDMHLYPTGDMGKSSVRDFDIEIVD